MPSSSSASSQKQVLIDVQDVSFSYPNSTGSSLHNINLRVHSGDRVLVVGHNGSGKSTLLSLLGGRRKPKSGTVRVMQRDPFDDTSMGAHIALMGAPWPAEAYFANTVDKIASPAPFPERKEAMAAALHLRLSRYVDKMSAGEKRRTQILHGMLLPATVYLLDECSTDIDVAERATVLDMVRNECNLRAGGGCCLYATHILDRIHDWATHVLLISDGRITNFLSVAEIKVPLEKFALQFMSKRAFVPAAGAHHDRRFVDPLREVSTAPTDEAQQIYLSPSVVNNNNNDTREAVIVCEHLTYKDIFADMSFTVYRGERVLLCGCNGSGKSTLLNMLGGKQFFPNSNGALQVLGKACYEDMTLNGLVAYGGDWWTTVPGGEVHVCEMMTVDSARGRHLRDLLAVDMSWDVRHISSGEQKRVQLLLYLLEDKPIVLLDEATADLDVDQRHALLGFLYGESERRGVTVMYSTHIFGGLDGWANTLILLDRTTRGVHAVWRANNIDLDALTQEMMTLKSKEVF